MTGANTYMAALEEVAKLSEEAESAARQQDWDRLVAILDRRQGLMEQIDAMPDEARRLTPEQTLFATQLLHRATEIDSASANAVDTALGSTRSVLQESSQTRAGISAYRRASVTQPHMHEARFVDKNR